MKILFIGGNGNISWYCAQKALEAGHTVYELNRSATLQTRRPIQPEIIKLTADFRDIQSVKTLFKDYEFDVVCDFICFNKEQATHDIELFSRKIKQFVFISTTSVYKRETRFLPFSETTEHFDNEEFLYGFGKSQAEAVFMSAYKENGFPITIVRPAYTYDTIVPISVGHNCFTAPQMYLSGNPVLIAGDGTNLYTFTHSRDFANALTGLLGNTNAIGEDFHITTDEWLTWNDMMSISVKTLGSVFDKSLSLEFVHIPTGDILKMDVKASKNMSISYLGKNFASDRMYCAIFNNSKIKRFVPGWKAETSFADGIEETFKWFREDEKRRRYNPELAELLTSLTRKYNK